MPTQKFARPRALPLLLVFSIVGPAQSFPGKEWAKADKPESAGFSARRLATLTPLLQTFDTSAMMVVSKGQVFEYGDLAASNQGDANCVHQPSGGFRKLNVDDTMLYI
jgi:hypothetical protein